MSSWSSLGVLGCASHAAAAGRCYVFMCSWEGETTTSAGVDHHPSVGFTSHCPSSKAGPGMALVACSCLGGATTCYILGTLGFLFWGCPGEEKGL